MLESTEFTIQEPIPEDINVFLERYPALAEAAAYGIDIHMLLDNLRRPVTERLERLQAAADLVHKLQTAKKL